MMYVYIRIHRSLPDIPLTLTSLPLVFVVPPADTRNIFHIAAGPGHPSLSCEPSCPGSIAPQKWSVPISTAPLWKEISLL